MVVRTRRARLASLVGRPRAWRRRAAVSPWASACHGLRYNLRRLGLYNEATFLADLAAVPEIESG